MATDTKGKRKIHKVMKEKKEGKLKSGSEKRRLAASRPWRSPSAKLKKSGAKIPMKS